MTLARYLVPFYLFMLIFTGFCYGQDVTAVTPNGKKVILHADGTWEFERNYCVGFNVSSYNSAKLKLTKGQSFNFYFNRAWDFVNQRGENSYDAIVNFEEAIKRSPTNGGVYSDLGNCYRGGFKCYSKAEIYYTKAIENGFTQGFVYYNRAICKYELNKLEEMRSDLKMANQLGWYNDYYNLSLK